MWGRLTIIGGAVALAAGGGVWWWQSSSASNLPTTEVVREAQPRATPRVRAAIVDEADEDARMLLCEQEKCRELKRPEADNNEAVFDGSNWYFYSAADEEEATRTASDKKILHKLSLSGVKELLMESTPLTSPRGLFMSPDGSALAFFLDNVGQPKEELTEVWLYDIAEGGTRVLAEKLYAPDIRSRLRWNRSNTQLWFVADTGEQDAAEDTLELLVVSVHPPGIAVAFQSLDWERLFDTADHDFMDISSDGTQLVYASRSLLGRTLLNIVREDGTRRQITSPGSLQHIEWLPDGALLYVTQDERGFTVWQDQNEVRRHVARRPGTFLSGHTDTNRATFVLAAAEAEDDNAALYALDLASGVMTEAGTFTREYDRVHVVHAAQQLPEEDTLSQVTRELRDEELAAFIDGALGDIVSPGAQPVRLIVTDKVNTIFVDYTFEGKEERLLFTVHDAALKEWTLRARYTQQAGEWRKAQGGGVTDPVPQRLYEWESSLERWILKQDFTLDEGV